MAKFDCVPTLVEINGSCIEDLVDRLSVPDNPILEW